MKQLQRFEHVCDTKNKALSVHVKIKLNNTMTIHSLYSRVGNFFDAKGAIKKIKPFEFAHLIYKGATK